MAERRGTGIRRPDGAPGGGPRLPPLADRAGTAASPLLNARYARIYLNDLLAVLAGSAALARRIRRRGGDERVMALADGAAAEFDRWMAAVGALMARTGLRRSRIAPMLGRVAEWAGRAKLNGHLLRPSPLSPAVELDALATALAHAGDAGAVLQWMAAPGSAEQAAFATMTARTAERRAEVEPLRLAAARRAILNRGGHADRRMRASRGGCGAPGSARHTRRCG
ncbi:MAG: hypothetical protein U0Y82_16135 [Thermoleophilia bacterium]